MRGHDGRGQDGPSRDSLVHVKPNYPRPRRLIRKPVLHRPLAERESGVEAGSAFQLRNVFVE